LGDIFRGGLGRCVWHSLPRDRWKLPLPLLASLAFKLATKPSDTPHNAPCSIHTRYKRSIQMFSAGHYVECLYAAIQISQLIRSQPQLIRSQPQISCSRIDKQFDYQRPYYYPIKVQAIFKCATVRFTSQILALADFLASGKQKPCSVINLIMPECNSR
jgi:hypothetical protein